MTENEKPVCLFEGPNARTYVEVRIGVTGKYMVYRVRPFPPPTRGDKVERFEADNYMAAVTLGAQLARDLNDESWHARLKNSLPEDWNKPDGVEGE